MKDKTMRRLIIAHRGAMAVAPENTESSFDKALRYPVDGFETDIQMTKDEKLVIFHDRTTKKLEKKPRPISEISFDEFRSLDCGEWFSTEFKGQKVMGLDEFLDRYLIGTRLMLELKSYPGDLAGRRRSRFLELLASSLNRFPEKLVRTHVSILSFDVPLLAEFHPMMPELEYVMNLETDSEYFEKPEKTPGFISVLCMDINDMDQRFSDSAKAAGRRLYAWSCNKKTEIARAIEVGIEGMMTDDPGDFFTFYK